MCMLTHFSWFKLQTARRRHGVPQITQPHQLVLGAVQALDTLLPNFRAEVKLP